MDTNAQICVSCERRYGPDDQFCPVCGLELITEAEWLKTRTSKGPAPSSVPLPVAPEPETRICLACRSRYPGSVTFCPTCDLELVEEHKPVVAAPPSATFDELPPDDLNINRELPMPAHWKPTELMGKFKEPPRPPLPPPKGFQKVMVRVGKYLPGIFSLPLLAAGLAVGGLGLWLIMRGYADFAGDAAGAGGFQLFFSLAYVMFGAGLYSQALMWWILGDSLVIFEAIMEFEGKHWLTFITISLFIGVFSVRFGVPLLIRS